MRLVVYGKPLGQLVPLSFLLLMTLRSLVGSKAPKDFGLYLSGVAHEEKV